MPREITLFEKVGDGHINTIEFMHDDVKFFHELFGRPEDDPLVFYVYQIDEEKNKRIFEKFGVMVDLEKYDCFVEFSA